MKNRYARLTLKKLSPTDFDILYQEIRKYIDHTNELRKLPINTTEWETHLHQRKASYNIIQTISGLSDQKIQDLIAGRTFLSTYWLSDGTIRRDY